MADPTRLHMRLKPADRALLDRLAERYGMTESGLIRWAIRYLDEHGPLQGRGGTVDNYTRRMDEQENAMLTETDDERPAYMWTSDRTRQVDYVRELASELISSQRFVSASDYADGETYAETIVSDYLEWMAEEREPMPDWWDEHDRGLLVRFIAQECES